MRSAIAALLVAACGAAPAPALESSRDETVEDGIELRLGCTLITRREIDEALARAAREGRRSSREEIRDEVARRAVMLRIAERHGVTVEQGEIDRAVTAIATENGLTEQQLWDAAAEQGLDREAYTEVLRSQLLELRLENALAGPNEEAERRAEVERRRAAGESADEQTIGRERLARALREAIERELSALRTRRVRGSGSGCVEVLDHATVE